MASATFRSYRHGLGDCHLVTLTNADNKRFRMLIDCGVVIGTPDATSKMVKVMKDVVTETGGFVDLLVATHRHWDHVSGFLQAADEFARLKVGEVWLAWTENPEDPDAKSLRDDQAKALALLQPVAARMHLAANGEPTLLTSLLEFFGAAGGATTNAAMEAVRRKSGAKLRYCDPKDAPTELAEFGARIYVLGPPRDRRALKKMLPTSQDETYKLALTAVEANLAGALSAADEEQPFTGLFRIPMSVAKQTPFFQARYWNDEDWRSIDIAWMDTATQLALALDNMINNTSLVLSIDLGKAGVLLLAADAQVGNWESWGQYEWTAEGRQVGATDLLQRTVLYKVGHHGSFNATLRKNGLDLMSNLRIAVIPVDHDVAVKKHWGDIPLNSLLAALERSTDQMGYVLRSDEMPGEKAIALGAKATDLYFEVTVV